jgi:hypothetical protein|tara:strand:- start:74 stop:388 length:315 start_codon:yes stop_codon:yes gene_type:complete
MAFELVETQTKVNRGSGRTTVQTAGEINTARTTTKTPAQDETSSTDQTQTARAHDIVVETESEPNETNNSITKEDRSIVARFAIQFQNREPVLPPGEISPSACP